MCYITNEKLREEQLNYLMQTHQAIRGEIQMRITQRDNFAIQFVIASGAVFTLGFLNFKYSPFLFFLLPLVTIFYSVQILSSYSIHERCHKFLCEEIEPKLCEMLGYNANYREKIMWESYCDFDKKQKKVKRTTGIRKNFFKKISYLMPFISSILFGFTSSVKETFSNPIVIVVISLLTPTIFLLLNCYFINFHNKKSTENTDKKDEK